jgi:hypothetical protein
VNFGAALTIDRQEVLRTGEARHPAGHREAPIFSMIAKGIGQPRTYPKIATKRLSLRLSQVLLVASGEVHAFLSKTMWKWAIYLESCRLEVWKIIAIGKYHKCLQQARPRARRDALQERQEQRQQQVRDQSQLEAQLTYQHRFE